MTPVKLSQSNSCLTSSTQFCFLSSPYQHRAAGPLLSVRSEYECPTTALQVHARMIFVCISRVYMCMCVAVEAVEPFLILRRVMIGDLVHSRKIICEFVKHRSSYFSRVILGMSLNSWQRLKMGSQWLPHDVKMRYLRGCEGVCETKNLAWRGRNCSQVDVCSSDKATGVHFGTSFSRLYPSKTVQKPKSVSDALTGCRDSVL